MRASEFDAGPPGPPQGAADAPAPGGPDPAGSLFTTDHIVRAAQEAIITVDEHQRIVMLNPAAQRMFGCTADDALGSNIARFLPERHRAAHAQQVREFSASGQQERRMAERRPVAGLRANGEEFPAEATISRLDVIGDGTPRRYFTALVRDLSEVRDLKAEIDTINRRMRTIFELAPIAIWITEAEQIVFVNRACAELFGTTQEQDLLGRSVYALLDPESRPSVRQAIELALGAGTPVPAVKERIRCLDGATREVEIVVAALPDHGRTALQMVLTDVTQRSAERRALERSRHELRQLSASLVDAREEERRRIARELHDELGQRLSALHMELSSLPQGPWDSGGTLEKRVKTMLGMVDETVASVRRIATELRPLMLDDLGLKAAIEWLAKDWSRRMGIAVALDLYKDDPEISEESAIAIYRMVQEALTNIARHAKASHATVGLHMDDADLLLTVRDDGIGFSMASMHRAGSHGLMGIRERAYMLGGHLDIDNSAAGGALIRVRLPRDATRATRARATDDSAEQARP